MTTKKHNQTNRNNIKIIIMEDRAYFEPRAQMVFRTPELILPNNTSRRPTDVLSHLDILE